MAIPWIIGKGEKNILADFIGKATGEDESLRIFIDKSVIEIFINYKICITEHIKLKNSTSPIYLSSKKGDINIKSLKFWKMKSIWE